MRLKCSVIIWFHLCHSFIDLEFVAAIVKLVCCAESLYTSNAALRAHVDTLMFFRNVLRSFGLPQMVICHLLSFWSAPRLMWTQKMCVKRHLIFSACIFEFRNQFFIRNCLPLLIGSCVFHVLRQCTSFAFGSGLGVWLDVCYWRQYVSKSNFRQSWVSVI